MAGQLNEKKTGWMVGSQRIVITYLYSSQARNKHQRGQSWDLCCLTSLSMILEKMTECRLTRFADHTKLERIINTSKGRATIPRDLDRWEEWANRSTITFTKDECKVLHWHTQWIKKPGLRSAPSNPLDSTLYATLQSALSKGFLWEEVPRDLPPVSFY